MPNVTTAQYKFLKFNNYDLSRVMDGTALDEQDDNIVDTEATCYVLGDGRLVTSVKRAVVADTTWTINPRLLKEDNLSIYNFLLNPPANRAMGSMIRVLGPLTTTFTNVVLIKGIDFKGSYEKFVNIVVKLQK